MMVGNETPFRTLAIKSGVLSLFDVTAASHLQEYTSTRLKYFMFLKTAVESPLFCLNDNLKYIAKSGFPHCSKFLYEL